MGKISSIGVDWLTCGGDYKTAGEAQALLATINPDQQRIPCVWMGYTGWRRVGMFYGEMGERWIVRLGSELANVMWRDFAPLATRCSRLDIQLTVAYSRPQIGLCGRLFSAAKAQSCINERYPKHSFIDSGAGNETFYLGDRSSERFFRCYDKGLQSGSKEQGELLRFELELKAEPALNVLRALVDAVDVPAAIGGYITRHLHEKNLYPPIPPFVGLKLPREKKEDKTDELKLEWLEKQVAATVCALMDKGMAAQVAHALGLIGIVDIHGEAAHPKSWR